MAAATKKIKEKEVKTVKPEAVVVPLEGTRDEIVVSSVAVPVEAPEITVEPIEGFIEAVGRRKTSTALARLSTGKKGITVNGKDYSHYFPTEEMQLSVEEPLRKMRALGKFSVSVFVRGGGIHSQVGAVRHAISRALIKFDSEFRTRLKKLGYLKRDPRMKERRKFGLKKARKAPQWAKR